MMTKKISKKNGFTPLEIRKSLTGFTFIELIVAVTIFSIMAVSIYSVFRAGVRLWSGTNPLIQSNQAARYFFNAISADLKNSVPYNALSSGPKTFGSSEEGKANFEGGKERISFMTLVDVSAAGVPSHAELARVVYSFDRSKKTLMRAVATKTEGLSEDSAKVAEVLNGIDDKDFGFEYCYKSASSPTEYSYEWKDAWEDEDRDKGKIPRGVRVKAGPYSKTIFIPTGRLGGKEGD